MMPLPPGPFGVILADPPWSFKSWSGKTGTPHRTAIDHYVTTKTDALADIPLADVAARDCALFMWVIDSHVDQALALGTAWGFGFKTIAFVWHKGSTPDHAKIGMGYWTRKQAETCFMFTRGKPKRMSAGVRQLIVAPRREHSRKPDEQYERIEALVGGPYLELFARQSRAGWSAWGNETEKFNNLNEGVFS
jgi:N6-adenosine-specific RNA methylase IME4